MIVYVYLLEHATCNEDMLNHSGIQCWNWCSTLGKHNPLHVYIHLGEQCLLWSHDAGPRLQNLMRGGAHDCQVRIGPEIINCYSTINSPVPSPQLNAKEAVGRRLGTRLEVELVMPVMQAIKPRPALWFSPVVITGAMNYSGKVYQMTTVMCCLS